MTSRLALPALAVAALVLPFVLSAAQLTIATFVVIAAIGATGLNIVTGYAGQISLGHAAFLAVGAYTGAVLGADHGLSAFVWIPAAGVVAALLGAIVGPLALRLRGLYLAIVTLGLVFIAQHVFFNADGLTGGPQGRAFPAVQLGSFDFSPGQVLSVGGVTIDSSGLYYFLGLALLAAATAFEQYVVKATTTVPFGWDAPEGPAREAVGEQPPHAGLHAAGAGCGGPRRQHAEAGERADQRDGDGGGQTRVHRLAGRERDEGQQTGRRAREGQDDGAVGGRRQGGVRAAERDHDADIGTPGGRPEACGTGPAGPGVATRLRCGRSGRPPGRAARGRGP